MFTYLGYTTTGTAAAEDATWLQTMIRNALALTPADAVPTPAPTLLIETGNGPDATPMTLPSSFAPTEAALAALSIQYDVLFTQDYTTSYIPTLDKYKSVVVAINGGSLNQADLQALSDFAAGGKNVVMTGGTYSSSFIVALTQSGLLQTVVYGDTPTWTASSSPDVSLWHASEANPLTKGLNATTTFTSLSNKYFIRSRDTAARVAARNGDGFPILLSKSIGGKGVFTYFGYTTTGTAATEDATWLQTMIRNALALQVNDVSWTRASTLLLETFVDTDTPAQYA